MTLRTRLIFPLILSAMFAASLAGQTVTVTATNINGGGQLLPAGTICFASTGATASGYHVGSTGQAGAPVCRDVVNGAIATTLNGTTVGTLTLADTALTAPANVCYKATVRDPSGGFVIGTSGAQRSGYDCVQPTADNAWCTAGVCNFDNYLPTLPNLALGQSIEDLTVDNLTVNHCTGDGCGTGGGSGVLLKTNGSNNSSQSTLNFQSGTGTTASNPSGGNEQINVVYGTTSSTAAQGNDSRITGAEQTSHKGQANGYAPLDSSSTVPAANIPSGTLGKVIIGQGAGVPGAYADPLVQGTQADGSSTEPSPVLVGVWDGANLRAAAGDTSGNAKVAVQGSVNVAGSFYQATQPVSVASLPLPSGAATAAKQPALGTAGTPAADVITVQGASSMTALKVDGSATTQPVSGTFWQATQPMSAADGSNVTLGAKADAANSATDTTPISIVSILKELSAKAQSPASTPVTGTFWQATQPVSGTFWQSTQPVSSTQLPAALDGSGFLKTHEQGTVPVTGTFWQTTQPVSNAGLTDIDSTIGTPGSAVPPKSVQVAGTDGTNAIVPYIDPCQRGARTFVSISLTANTKLITGTSSKKIYVCDIHIVAAAATNVAIVEGTGTVCATSTAGVGGMGGATAATGWNLSANGGIVLGNGGYSIGAEGTAADDLCLFVSAANQISGGLSYVVN